MVFIGKRHTKIDKTMKTDKYLTIKPYVFNIFYLVCAFNERTPPVWERSVFS